MIIFLDIDGVMVSGAIWRPVILLEDGFYEFLPSAVNALLKVPNASIVLTTSHRFKYSTLEWKKIFERRNIFNNISILESRLEKKEAILEWFENNKTDDFVIIDDDRSMNSLPLYLKERLILTTSLKGLTYEDINWLD